MSSHSETRAAATSTAAAFRAQQPTTTTITTTTTTATATCSKGGGSGCRKCRRCGRGLCRRRAEGRRSCRESGGFCRRRSSNRSSMMTRRRGQCKRSWSHARTWQSSSRCRRSSRRRTTTLSMSRGGWRTRAATTRCPSGVRQVPRMPRSAARICGRCWTLVSWRRLTPPRCAVTPTCLQCGRTQSGAGASSRSRGSSTRCWAKRR